jgi:hypothetical protein
VLLHLTRTPLLWVVCPYHGLACAAGKHIEMWHVTGTDLPSALAATAALASTALVLRAEYDGRDDQTAYVDQIQRTAKDMFDKRVDKAGKSYTAVVPDLAARFPSTDAKIADKQFYAAAWVHAMFPDDKALKDVLNYYFSFAEEMHDYRPCTVDEDNLFVAGNFVMSHFEKFDPRYRLHVERCVATWTGQKIFKQDLPSPLRFIMQDNQMLMQRTAYDGATQPPSPDIGGSRPLPLAMRAMAFTAAYTAIRLEPVEVHKRFNLVSACYSLQQTRMLLGYNDNLQSYVVGVAHKRSTWPKQARVRAATCEAAGPCGVEAETAGSNLYEPYGAIVHGRSLDGSYVDSRADIEHNGVSLLNLTPMPLLVAAHTHAQLKPQDCLGLGLGVQ